MLNINIKNTVKFSYKIYEEKIIELVKTTLKVLKIDESKFEEIYLDISLVGQTKIRTMNKTYRYVDKVTDVLSFPVDNPLNSHFPIVSIGDIYVCMDRVYSQAAEYNHSFERELLFLICHGLLHLLGYDHILEEDDKKMRKMQRKIMKKIGVKR